MKDGGKRRENGGAPAPSGRRLPVWVFYLAVGFVLAVAYAVYLQGKIAEFDKELADLRRQASQAVNALDAEKRSAAFREEQLNNRIAELQKKLQQAEEAMRDALDKAGKDAIRKLDEERAKWKAELERVIAYYQRRFKTRATPPPPKRR